MSDNFFEWLGKGFSEPFTHRKSSFSADKYIKGLDKYNGRRISKDEVDKWKTTTIGKGSISGGITNSVRDDIWSSISGGVASTNNDVEHENAKITGKLEVDGIDVGATLKTLQERFLILEEDFEKHEQYPALKDAYEKYKLIEKLLKENK